jgi:hypothetical protein
MEKKKTKRPSCEDYFRMPLGEEVFDHIRSCESCRAWLCHINLSTTIELFTKSPMGMQIAA